MPLSETTSTILYQRKLDWSKGLFILTSLSRKREKGRDIDKMIDKLVD